VRRIQRVKVRLLGLPPWAMVALGVALLAAIVAIAYFAFKQPRRVKVIIECEVGANPASELDSSANASSADRAGHSPGSSLMPMAMIRSSDRTEEIWSELEGDTVSPADSQDANAGQQHAYPFH